MMRVMKCAAVLGAIAWTGVMVGQPPAASVEAVPPPQAVATLTIDASKPVAKVSPTLYGLMTEEINYSYDGGLYGELVQDRTFQSSRSDTENWVPVSQGIARGSVMRDASSGPSAALTASLKMTVTQADAGNAYGLRNRGRAAGWRHNRAGLSCPRPVAAGIPAAGYLAVLSGVER